MGSKSNLFFVGTIMTVFALMIVPVNISAADNQIIISPINEKTSLEKTVMELDIPEDNILPWASVRGTVSENVDNNPVIIQFYQNDELVHVAQAEVNEDGSYEYKFRVRDVDNNTGKVTNVFEGQYSVNVFKVIFDEKLTI